ncbi:LOW QUALITY PROTEIN: hypothetical protein PHMEG_00014143 [Phytophthora megakarya]|uniref:Chromo domain-containing protein n=1 Tax=Phytophthora megakarya TaxID=4795 RepID=A0A225W6N9_9STRA|nr:LOW QUALITY PROTEIN: hypothetical protein PHMEG_00014143 [Phytophthora megakarya]
MIYQRMMDNALWGFGQPKGSWNEYSERMRSAEEDVECTKTGVTEGSTRPRSKFEPDRESASNPDPVTELVNSSVGDMFSNGEPDESSETVDGCLSTLDRLPQRFPECRISVSFTKSMFVQSRIDFLSHQVVPEGLRSDAKKSKWVTEFSFPTSKKGMQSFLGSLNYYSRLIQDIAVYAAALYQLKEKDFEPGGDLLVAQQSFAKLQQKIRDAPILRHFDRRKEVHGTLFANEWALSSTLMQEHDDKRHPVRFSGRVLKEAEMKYHPAEKEVLALLLLLKTCYLQLAGRTIYVYTQFSTLEWAHTFAEMLSPWHLVVNRVKEKDCAFAQLLQAGLTSFVDLEDSLATVTPPVRGSSTVRMDPELFRGCLSREILFALHHSTLAYLDPIVVSFDGSAKIEKYGGCGSCSWIVWRLPDWTIFTAASAYLEATTVNMAEYFGMNNGVQAALDISATDLVIVGDSRLAIQQSLESVKYLHALREYNASADSLATEALKNKASSVISTEPRLAELRSLNRIQEVIYAPITESTVDKPSVSIAQSQVQTRHLRHMKPSQLSGTVPEPRRNNFFDFVRRDQREIGDPTVTTRLQAKSKLNAFADETSVTGEEDATQREEANGVPTEDSVRQEAELSRITVPNCDTPVSPNAENVDSLTVQRERRRRIATAQDEKLRWANLKTVLRGDESTLTYRAARDARKMSEHFVLSEDNVLYYVGTRPLRSDQQQEDAMLLLVVPSTTIQDGLQIGHDSLEGGHQGIARTFYIVKLDYYWIGLYADVARHLKQKPTKDPWILSGEHTSGTTVSGRFDGFCDTLTEVSAGQHSALTVPMRIHGIRDGQNHRRYDCSESGSSFEECVYRRFGAPSLIRHDRDQRFMSEVFQSFTEMMQSRSRATLSCQPQANDQQERSVKTVMQSVCVYAEDPLQQDWGEIAEMLIYAINNSMDTTRKETPFFLVHGWDAQSTLKAMSSSLKRELGRQSDALAWRREVNRQQEITLEMTKEYQATEKARRAKKRNETLRGRGRSMTQKQAKPLRQVMIGLRQVTEDSDGDVTGVTRSLLEVGSRVWLYMERVKPRLAKTFSHRWHGLFRVKRKVEEFAYELELPDGSGYRFYPVVHVSRLTMINEFGDRPSARLTQDANEASRLDFDEDLFPEDNWEPGPVAGEFEVEAILDDRTPLSPSTERAVREFKVKWVGYDDPTWEPASNLSCGGLLFDYLREKCRDRRLQMG